MYKIIKKKNKETSSCLQSYKVYYKNLKKHKYRRKRKPFQQYDFAHVYIVHTKNRYIASAPNEIIASRKKSERAPNKVHRRGLHASLKTSVELRLIHDLHEESVKPPQAAAIIIYSNRTITNVNKALP